MARAKRTARAEARRRYRAQLDTVDGTETTDAEIEPAPPPTPRRDPRRATSRDPLAPPPMPTPAGGIANAFRAAFRPLNLREDLRLLPLLVRNRAFWLPIGLAAIVTGVIVAFEGRELISRVLAQYFLGPAPVGAAFLAGFLAPRASYLIGLLVGIACGILTLVAAQVVQPGATPVLVIEVLTTSPISSALFAAAAAWYRRFLYLASPARRLDARRPPQRGKPARGR